MDDDDDDAIATNRKKVNWELQKTLSLFEWGRRFLKQYVIFWSAFRRLLKETESKKFLKSVSMTSPMTQNMIKQFTKVIDNENALQGKASKLAKSIVSEASRGPVYEMMKRVLHGKITYSPQDLEFANLYIEQVHIARQLAVTRYKIINIILHNNTKNGNISLDYVTILKECPWILSPDAIALYESKEILEELRKLGDENNFNPPDLLLEKDSSFYGETEYYIVKVKMTDFVEEDIERFIETISWLEELLDEKGYAREINPVIIGTEMNEACNFLFSSIENGIFVTQQDIIRSMNRLLLLTYISSDRIMQNTIDEKFAEEIKPLLKEVNVDSNLSDVANLIVDKIWDKEENVIREEYREMVKERDITERNQVIDIVYYEILAATIGKV